MLANLSMTGTKTKPWRLMILMELLRTQMSPSLKLLTKVNCSNFRLEWFREVYCYQISISHFTNTFLAYLLFAISRYLVDWPYVFVVLQGKEITKGSELLIKYSKDYWGARTGEAGQEHGGILANQLNFPGNWFYSLDVLQKQWLSFRKKISLLLCLSWIVGRSRQAHG